MPGREARDIISKSLNLIYYAQNSKTKGLLLSTQAFDGVSWDYMLATCSHIGLDVNMLSWISALYQNPQTKIKINNTLSDPIEISNGTRQGCPLSPILFISLEPLIRSINLNNDIQGFIAGKREYKTAAYPDDLLFFITQPYTSIPNLKKLFEIFGFISNFKINQSKSEVLNLNLPPDHLKLLKQNYSYKWEQSTLKYLGINLTRNIDSLYSFNYKPLLTTITNDLNRWTSKSFSWFGRASILKMTVLPRLLYLFNALPIKLPDIFFSKLLKTQRRFLWAGKKLRINWVK